MPNPYDISEIFKEMERELLASYRRNMARHAADEVKEGFQWTMWQATKLDDLKEYRAEAQKIIAKLNTKAKFQSSKMAEESFKAGAILVNEVLETALDEGFGRLNRRKLNALISSVNNNLDVASHAALRHVDDAYRQIIFKTQFMYSAGAKTLPQAIDQAADDFLKAGINCIQYNNGARVNIASYAEMVLRTSDKRAYLIGEGERMADLGEYLVQVTSYGACSETCLPWQGRVYVDDIYAGGKPDGVHDRLSTAIAEGLYHPNCRHTHGPYFEGISYAPKQPKSVEEIQKTYAAEQKQRGIERKIREWKRVAEGSVEDTNRVNAQRKVAQWQATMRNHLAENPFLSRNYSREHLYA